MKTQRTSQLPLLYTHPIGSLPRPKLVRDVLGRRDEMGAESHRSTLDDLVRVAIHLQECAGLDVVSDGEWRRVQYAEGYRWIMVNGDVTFEDGKCTDATPGKLLRHGRG